jgi:hypothetical protein
VRINRFCLFKSRNFFRNPDGEAQRSEVFSMFEIERRFKGFSITIISCRRWQSSRSDHRPCFVYMYENMLDRQKFEGCVGFPEACKA